MKHLNIYKNESFNMKPLATYITEYIINKKLDTPINSEGEYHPQTKEELIENIKECFDDNNYDLNCIDTRAITDMSNLFENIVNNINEFNYWDINEDSDKKNSNDEYSFEILKTLEKNVTNNEHLSMQDAFFNRL